jgi:hypothetical protein
LLLSITAHTVAAAGLSRTEAQRLLDVTFAPAFQTICVVTPESPWYRKPEFAALRGTQICSIVVDITGVRQLGPSEAKAEWNWHVRANRGNTEKWLESFDRFRARLLTLKPVQRAGLTIFTDPEDKQTFTTTGQPLTASSDWLQLERIADTVRKLLTADIVTPMRSSFALYDDGWRIIKPQPEGARR